MADNTKIVKRKVRNAYMVSTVSIALVLFLLGSVGYLIMGALGATERLKESVTVYVMLDDNITAERSDTIKKQLTANAAVKEVKFISKDEAAADFKSYLGDDFVEFLQQNPLPDSYEIKLDADSSEREVLSRLEKEIAKWSGVNEVVYQRNVIEQISSNINKFNTVLLLFGVALLVISLILLNNTIRITIFTKRSIIKTMRLVGATPWFIMRPFLLSSVLQGIYSALISWVMLMFMIMGLHEGLPEVNFVSDNRYVIAIFGIMMVGGVLISFLFTTFSVRKFLKMNSNNMMY